MRGYADNKGGEIFRTVTNSKRVAWEAKEINRSFGREQRGKGVAGPGRSEMRIIIARRRSTLNVSNRGRSAACLRGGGEGMRCRISLIKINLALLPLPLQGGARDKTNATDQDIGRYSSVLC